MGSSKWRGLALLMMLLSSFEGSAAPKQEKSRLSKIQVAPDPIVLWGGQGAQRVVVIASYPDGRERDITGSCQFSVENSTVAGIDAAGRVVGAADGQTELKVQCNEKTARVKITVSGYSERRSFSFARDIGGILTKRGCNNSECHGGVKGQGGFKLSTNVLHPKDDYRWVIEGGVYEVMSAESKPSQSRINLREPEKSLLLLKPTEAVPHGGGRRLDIESSDYKTILEWVRKGAHYGEEHGEAPVSVVGVEVFPRQVVLDAEGNQQLLVTAVLSNGRREDITDQALYSSNNAEVVQVTASGLMKAVRTGETAVVIRTAGNASSVGVGVIGRSVSAYPSLVPANYIDEHVFAKLRRFNLIPSPRATDEEFLRRVSLDLTGLLPPSKRVREFLGSKEPDKRQKVVDRLFESPEYVDYWTFRFSQLFRVYFGTQQYLDVTERYRDWVRTSIAENKPYDQIARERIAAQGREDGPVTHYFHIAPQLSPAQLVAEEVRVFLGRRMDCAQCHNHPYDVWSQDQFWGLAAFFGGISRASVQGRYSIMADFPLADRSENAKVIHPRTKTEVQPAFLDGVVVKDRSDLRGKLAEKITSHPYFAEAAVNRIWGYFFGRGLVDPVDDFRLTNPPTHPDLLTALARDFRENGHDLRRLMRLIVLSRTYQTSGTLNETNAEDKVNYSRAGPRPLEAEVLLDAISDVTGVSEQFRKLYYDRKVGALPPGTRAVDTFPDLVPSQFLESFMRYSRQTLFDGGPKSNLAQALHMWSGKTFNDKISATGGRLERMLKDGRSDREIIEEFYLAALSRYPSVQERAKLEKLISYRKNLRKQALENLVWAFISSREFAFNH